MPKLRNPFKWLREFGHGFSLDMDKAHDFTADEAVALCALYPGYVPDGDGYGSTTLDCKQPPHWSPGDDMVWVQYRGCWFAAERQALFMATRGALRAHRAGTVVA